MRIRKALGRANAIVESAVDDVTAKDIEAAAKDLGPTETVQTTQPDFPTWDQFDRDCGEATL